MLYGYARVSTTDQDLDIQETALKAAGCEVVRSEKISGTSTNGRTEPAPPHYMTAMIDYHQTNGDRGEICVPYDGNFVILGTPCPLLR
jgi:hypothetical protein